MVLLWVSSDPLSFWVFSVKIESIEQGSFGEAANHRLSVNEAVTGLIQSVLRPQLHACHGMCGGGWGLFYQEVILVMLKAVDFFSSFQKLENRQLSPVLTAKNIGKSIQITDGHLFQVVDTHQLQEFGEAQKCVTLAW